MPKFNLYAHPGPDGTDGDTRIEVGWTKAPAGDVQLATTKLLNSAYRHREYTDGPNPRPAWDGSFVHLDRDQINHLIRQLRDARDGAFGRDE